MNADIKITISGQPQSGKSTMVGLIMEALNNRSIVVDRIVDDCSLVEMTKKMEHAHSILENKTIVIIVDNSGI